MRNITLALVCMACGGHGRRVRSSLDGLRESPVSERLMATASGFTELLLELSLHPTASFKPCSARAHISGRWRALDEKRYLGSRRQVPVRSKAIMIMNCTSVLVERQHELAFQSSSAEELTQQARERLEALYRLDAVPVNKAASERIEAAVFNEEEALSELGAVQEKKAARARIEAEEEEATKAARARIEAEEKEALHRMEAAQAKKAARARIEAEELEALYRRDAVPGKKAATVRIEAGEETEEYEKDYSNDNEEDNRDEDKPNKASFRILTPAECSDKLDEIFASKKAISGAKKSFDDLEIQALVFAIKKEHSWIQKRNATNEQRRQAKTKRLSDASFAKQLGLKGGAAEYRSELLRLSLAKDLLVEGMADVVRSKVRDYLWIGLPAGDLATAGRGALIRAALRYNPKQGRLATFAKLLIGQDITGELHKSSRLLRLPKSITTQFLNVTRLRGELFARGFNKAEVDRRLLNMTGMTEKRMGKVQRTIRSTKYGSMNVKERLGLENDLRGQEIGDTIESETSTAMATFINRYVHSVEVQRLMRNFLTPREIFVLNMRFGLEAGTGGIATLDELGQVLKISLERVRQIESAALLKLRARFERRRQSESAAMLQLKAR